MPAVNSVDKPLLVRAIDNNQLIKKIGELPESLSTKVEENLVIILDIN